MLPFSTSRAAIRGRSFEWDAAALGPSRGVSTREWFETLRDLSLGIGELGIAAGDCVAILGSESRPEWLVTDMAILCRAAP